MGKCTPRPRKRKSVERWSSLPRVSYRWSRESTVSSFPGRCTSSCTSARDSSSPRLPLAWPRYMARMKSAVNWQVKALVEATPISGPAWGIDGAGSLAGDHGADHVADGERARSFALGFALGRQGVGSLAGLRDDDGQSIGDDDGVAVAE